MSEALKSLSRIFIKERLIKAVNFYNQKINELPMEYKEFIKPFHFPEPFNDKGLIAYPDSDMVVYGDTFDKEFAIGDLWFINNWEYVKKDIEKCIQERVEDWKPVVEKGKEKDT